MSTWLYDITSALFLSHNLKFSEFGEIVRPGSIVIHFSLERDICSERPLNVTQQQSDMTRAFSYVTVFGVDLKHGLI